MSICVLAAGTWGLSLAHLLDANGHQVRLWDADRALLQRLANGGRHPRLLSLEVSPRLRFEPDLATALEDAVVVVCVVPAPNVREVCRRWRTVGDSGQPIILGAKGIEQGRALLLSEVIAEELEIAVMPRLAVLSGPSHAEEVVRNVPTAVVAASESETLRELTLRLFSRPSFRVFTQQDVVGVELAGALKNVIAIACGAADGLGLGDNTKAALLTRGQSEIVRLGLSMGAQPQTFYGLAGMGDLVVTCMSPHSRNWQFGSLLGQGRSVAQALAEVGMVVEGYHTTKAAMQLAAKHTVTMPITSIIHAVIHEGMSPQRGVQTLMRLQPRAEHE